MTAKEAKARFTKYLKSHFIKFYVNIGDDTVEYLIVHNGYELCPDRILESSVRFFPDDMEVRVYYSQSGAKWCSESEHKPELMCLFNYINAMVWPRAADGMNDALYKPHYLYAPRIYMTEDDCCDITMTFPINYSFYEAAPLETEDFITACCPKLMNDLSPAIFMLLIGEMSLEQAISYIRTNILGADPS